MSIRILDIITWILFIVSVIVFLWYIFGNSPTMEESILILIVTFLFAINAKLSGLSTRFILLEKSFSCLAKDFKQHISKK